MRSFLTCLLVLAVAVCPVAGHASIVEEREMGERFSKEARRGLPIVDDYEVETFITDIGTRLVATLGDQPFDYEFFVVGRNDINAFAVPGGKIVIHAGLISRVESEDELAGVMGHEVAHSHAHHIVRQQKKAAPINYATMLGALFGAIVHPALLAGVLTAGTAAQMTYQRDYEREADFLGVEYARDAGFQDGAIMQLLRKLYVEQQRSPTLVPPYFLSHPLSGERLTNLEAMLGRREWEATKLEPSWRLMRAAAIVRANSQTRHQAVPDYERRLSAASAEQRPVALELIGVLMTHGDDYAQAEVYLEEAESLGRNVDRELGRVYLRRGRLEDARPRLERAVAAAPGDWNALEDLGTLEHQAGNHDDAVVLLEKTFELRPHKAEVARTLGRALAKSGKTGAGFYRFAQAAELEGQHGLALTYYQKALAEIDESDPLHGEISEKVGPLEEAVDKEKAAMPRVRRYGGWPRSDLGAVFGESLP